jgi:hypothetical protein
LFVCLKFYGYLGVRVAVGGQGRRSALTGREGVCFGAVEAAGA